ncbi:hypothetical protein PIB30_088535 [Stylosanthes scabra]|uniref:Uncharacterized protein n=1 Tax=Stylosanthes scabra TaxID=79078 RepID=A0ABU6WTN6_9FABA|nr:hypothetical protein [Stylosanthes scabra]
MADNNQHFKVRATSTTKGVFDVTPSETTILTKSLVDIAAMLKEIKEGQQVTPKLLTRQANHSQQLPVKHCETLRAYQQDSREMKEKQQRLESQLSHITDMLHKFTNQPNFNVQSQPSTSSPLPSQPLPNPKGGINMVHNEVTQKEEEKEEEKGEDDDWLYELLAELANSDDEDDNEEAEEESEEEADEDDIEGETEGETFFIATVFNKNEEAKTEIPVKCEDPGPCLVTCKIRGVDVRECLCDPDASIVKVASIAKDVLVKVGQLMNPTDFHIIRPTEGEKGGRPQVLLGRSFLKIAGFKLHYVEDVFSLSNMKLNKLLETKEKENECLIEGRKLKKGSRIAPPSLKEDGKKESSKPAKKKKQHEEVKTRKKKKHEEDVDGGKIALKCSSLGNLLGKLKKIGKALRNNKKINAHLVKDQSKWK